MPFAIECVGTETGISQGSLFWNRSYFATPDSSPAPEPSATLHLEWRRGFHGLQSDCVPSSVYDFCCFTHLTGIRKRRELRLLSATQGITPKPEEANGNETRKY